MNTQIINLSTSKLALFSLLLLSAGFYGCDADETQSLPGRSYELTWSDEFDGPAGQAPSEQNWIYDIGRGPGNDGWGNQELQYYTDRSENVSLDGQGNLVITAKRETFSGAPFTSARIKTKGLFSQQYGRVEANIKTPYGPGLWPAFWMLGSNIDEVNWPQCGEIDIMELRGQQPNIINGTIHGPGYNGGAAIGGSRGLVDGRYDTDFHLFAVEWGVDYIDFFVDDNLYFRVTPEDVPGEWVFDNDFFLLLNVAVGGDYVGFPIGDTPFPQEMVVDFVKVYKQI